MNLKTYNTFNALLKSFHKGNVVYISTESRKEEFIRLLNGTAYEIVYVDDSGCVSTHGFKKKEEL